MTNAAIYCRNCGKPLTDEDKATPGRILCSVCAPAPSAVPPPTPTPPPSPNVAPSPATDNETPEEFRPAGADAP